MLGALRWALQERCGSGVGRDVLTNEITYVDFFTPKPINKGFV